MSRSALRRSHGWPIWPGKPGSGDWGGWAPGYTETLRYFDTANLATRVKCPTTIAIGLGDYVCPPSGQMILFRNLAGEKTIKIHQNRIHGRCLQPDPYETVFTGEIR
ncbi:acetylxylan esterase [uncultured Victivallis sp.]|uniref:acetylxylan esterase n=1 Tax=uncultured Victivallis sp. TaxID=354118 RepID=UPI00345A2FD1